MHTEIIYARLSLMTAVAQGRVSVEFDKVKDARLWRATLDLQEVKQVSPPFHHRNTLLRARRRSAGRCTFSSPSKPLSRGIAMSFCALRHLAWSAHQSEAVHAC
jgi:hypothetical protein